MNEKGKENFLNKKEKEKRIISIKYQHCMLTDAIQ